MRHDPSREDCEVMADIQRDGELKNLRDQLASEREARERAELHLKVYAQMDSEWDQQAIADLMQKIPVPMYAGDNIRSHIQKAMATLLRQRDEARAIAAEGRRAGRAEAARILMEQDAETFPGDSSPDAKNAVVFNQEIGISGDYATRWDEEKVRALFELGKERTAFDDFADRVESESWDQVGLQLELDMARQERDALQAKLSDHGPDGHNVTNLQYVNERDDNARLRGQVAGLLFILKNCESVFREYAQIHEMKLTPEGTRKAAANRGHADHIAKVLAGYAAPAPDATKQKGGAS